MRKCLKLGIVIYFLILLFGPKDKESDFIMDPHQIILPDTTSKVLDSIHLSKPDLTPYPSNWIDVEPNN